MNSRLFRTAFWALLAGFGLVVLMALSAPEAARMLLVNPRREAQTTLAAKARRVSPVVLSFDEEVGRSPNQQHLPSGDDPLHERLEVLHERVERLMRAESERRFNELERATNLLEEIRSNGYLRQSQRHSDNHPRPHEGGFEFNANQPVEHPAEPQVPSPEVPAPVDAEAAGDVKPAAPLLFPKEQMPDASRFAETPSPPANSKTETARPADPRRGTQFTESSAAAAPQRLIVLDTTIVTIQDQQWLDWLGVGTVESPASLSVLPTDAAALVRDLEAAAGTRVIASKVIRLSDGQTAKLMKLDARGAERYAGMATHRRALTSAGSSGGPRLLALRPTIGSEGLVQLEVALPSDSPSTGHEASFLQTTVVVPYGSTLVIRKGSGRSFQPSSPLAGSFSVLRSVAVGRDAGSANSEQIILITPSIEIARRDGG